IKPTQECYEDLARRAGCSELIRRSPFLVAYESEQSYRKDAFGWKLRRERGVVTEEVDAAGLRKLVPQLAPIYDRGVVVPEQGYVANPERLSKVLRSQFQKDGGTILTRKVVGL